MARWGARDCQAGTTAIPSEVNGLRDPGEVSHMAQWDDPTSTLPPEIPRWSIPGYSHEQFIQDLPGEHETEMQRYLKKGAHKVQVDFTEKRLAVKTDRSGDLLNSFIDLNVWQPDGVTWLP